MTNHIIFIRSRLFWELNLYKKSWQSYVLTGANLVVRFKNDIWTFPRIDRKSDDAVVRQRVLSISVANTL